MTAGVGVPTTLCARTVKPRGEAADAFFVLAELKLGMKKGDGPFGERAEAKLSVVEASRPVFLIITNVSLMMVMSAMGTQRAG